MYSFERTATHYTEKVTTQKRGVVDGIKYYVPQKFKQNYASNREQLRRVSAVLRGGGRSADLRWLLVASAAAFDVDLAHLPVENVGFSATLEAHV